MLNFLSPFEVSPSLTGVDQEPERLKTTNTTTTDVTQNNDTKQITEILIFNSRSILNKLTHLSSLLTSNMYDFIFISETWLKPCYNDSFIVDASNYHIVRSDRLEHRGGGVAVIYKNSFSYKIDVVNIESYDIIGFELLAFDYYYSTYKHARFICLYLPPSNAKDIEIMKTLIKTLKKLTTHDEVYILGDFNLSNITWTPCLTGEGDCALQFLTFLADRNLTQLISSPTRYRNVLDLFISSTPHKVLNTKVIEPFTITCDHNMIEVSLKMSCPQKINKTPKRNFYKGNYNLVRNFLSTINWNLVLYGSDNVEVVYNGILDILQQAIHRYIPISKNGRKSKLNPRIKHLLYLKKKYYKLSKEHPEAKTKYKHFDKLYRNAVSENRKKKELNIINNNNKNCLYKYINKKLHTPTCIPPLTNELGELVFQPQDKANLFNKKFASIFVTDNGLTPQLSPNFNAEQAVPMSLPYITQADVRKAVSELKNTVSQTPDGIPALFLKQTLDQLIYPLTAFFNLSLSKGVLPSLWKKSLVVPIFKKGLKGNPLNYRPISLTSVICRVLEKIIHNKMLTHLLSNNLLSNEQHGFIKNRSTLSQQVCLMNSLTQYHETWKPSEMIYLDFSKAFDTVSHQKLVFILSHFKINPTIIFWLQQYLTGRTQRTTLDGSFSSPCSTSSGVPQGSVLGPLLFVLYIEDLLRTLKADCPTVSIYAFADDLKLMSSEPNALKTAISIVETWTHLWQLNIQPAKTEHIVFERGKKTDQNTQPYIVSGVPAKTTTVVKDLGLLISNNLKWSTHITHISSKASKLSNIILRSFSASNLHTYTLLYKSYIRPLVEYNTSIWAPYSQGDLDTVENVQRRYTKRICQKLNIKFNGYKQRLDILNLETLENRRIKLDLVLVYKIVNGLIFVNQTEIFQVINTSYNLRRHKLSLRNPFRITSDIGKYFFTNRIIKVWNDLPETLVNSETLATFKSGLNSVNLERYCKLKL